MIDDAVVVLSAENWHNRLVESRALDNITRRGYGTDNTIDSHNSIQFECVLMGYKAT